MEILKKIFLGVVALVFTASLILSLKLTLVDGIVRKKEEVKKEVKKDDSNINTTTTTVPIDTKVNTENYIEKSIEDIDDNGLLVLVNHSNATEEVSQSKLKMTDNGLHYVRDDIYDELMALMDYMDGENYPIFINSSFRTIAEQKEIYDSTTDKKWTAKAGESEHHTGLAFDLIALAETEEDTEKANETYKILADKCDDFGFILRYPEGKEALTEIDYEYWHYRYLGIPHSKYITENGLALEEYVDMLHNEKPIEMEYDGISYRVYAVRGDKGTIKVPNNHKYDVSNDNTGYYIVTEYLDETIE